MKKKMGERLREVEELVVEFVLQSKAEVMAIRDLLLEKDLVSPEEWDELVTQHRKSYDYSRMIHDLEERRDFEAETSDTQTFLER